MAKKNINLHTSALKCVCESVCVRVVRRVVKSFNWRKLIRKPKLHT